MSIRREQALVRVRTVLVDLESQSEGRAMTWDGDKISRGENLDGQVLTAPPSEFERALKDLEAWHDKWNPPPPRPKPETKPEELRFRILNDYAGRNSERVADEESCTQKYVEDLRASHGFTRRHGLPNRKAAKT